MKINKVIVENLFSFFGRSEITFSKHTAILGENGFGKTSFLNSLKFAFGKEFEPEEVLNLNSENEKASILVETDLFSIYRELIFENRIFEKEILKISFQEFKLENLEAKEFLQEKFPIQILDFIFFDGEIEKGLSIFDKTAVRKILEIAFNLDIIINAKKDLTTVKNRIFKTINNSELEIFKSLIIQKEQIVEDIEVIQQNIIDLKIELKNISKEVSKTKRTLEKENLEFLRINNKITEISQEETINIEEFQSINMFSFPLILNSKLCDKVKENSQFLQIDNKLEFEDRFSKFHNFINTKLSKEELLSEFYKIFGEFNLDFEVSYSKNNLSDLFQKILENRNAINDLKKMKTIYLDEVASEKIKELNNNLNQFLSKEEELSLKISEFEKQLSEKRLALQKIEANLRVEFLEQREKYSKIKTIEEIVKLEKASETLLIKERTKSLKRFNRMFYKNQKSFLEKYVNLKEIFIDDNFNIATANNSLELLSSGQKQILSFIFVTTILDFYNISSSIFVDTPFGRLSFENRDFILSLYFKFENITLLLTNSEVNTLLGLNFQIYKIFQDNKGSKIVN